jgi:hypothetical protein
MGYATYSSENRSTRAAEAGYAYKSREQIFPRDYIFPEMDPRSVKIREAKDSDNHPNSIPIILGLDVTGSMLDVPAQLVKEGLPTMITSIIQAGTPDPQLLILGIGDHEYDDAPIQISQFESGDEELDHWLTNLYLEQGGGANDGESYLLAWYVGAFKTSSDNEEKRNKKGFLFTIGDEKCLRSIHGNTLNFLFDSKQEKNYTAEELLKAAQKKYNVFHIHTTETGSGRRRDIQDHWEKLLGNNLKIVQHHSEIPALISNIIITEQLDNVQSENKNPIKENTADNVDIYEFE